MTVVDGKIGGCLSECDGNLSGLIDRHVLATEVDVARGGGCRFSWLKSAVDSNAAVGQSHSRIAYACQCTIATDGQGTRTKHASFFQADIACVDVDSACIVPCAANRHLARAQFGEVVTAGDDALKIEFIGVAHLPCVGLGIDAITERAETA